MADFTAPDILPQSPDQINSVLNQTTPAAPGGPVKGGLRSVLSGILQNFSYGAGQAMKKQAGLPTDQEIAMQNAAMAHQNAQTQMVNQQTEQMKNLTPVDLGDGTVVRVPTPMATKLLEARIKAQGQVSAAQINKRFLTTPQGIFDTQKPDANGFPTAIPNSGQGITVTKEIADDYGLPADYIGKFAKLTDLAAAQKGNASQYGFVMGANGPAREQKVGPTGSLGLGSPSVTAAGARYVPVQDTVTGAVTYMPAAQAAATGAISPQTNLEKNAFIPQARFQDIDRVVGSVNKSVDAYDQDAVQKGLIAKALNSPESQGMGALSSAVRSGLMKGMNTKSRDLVTSVLSLREQIMGANAMLTGANGTTDARIQAIWDTLPNGTEPDSDMARRKMGLVNGMMGNLKSAFPQTQLIGNGTGVPKPVKARMDNTQKPKPTQSNGGFDWGSAPAVK